MARRRQQFDPNELGRGRRHEMEHVDDESFAQIIAEDHLREDPQYYTRLEACMPHGACPTCRPNPRRRLPPRRRNPVDDDGVVNCPACGGEPNFMGRMGSTDWYRCRQCGMDFHPAVPLRREPRRNATTAEKREYLHESIDELLYPKTVRRRADVGALRRVADDTGARSELDDLLVDPSLADEYEWLVPDLVRELHRQVTSASSTQIDVYTGPFFRMPGRNPRSNPGTDAAAVAAYEQFHNHPPDQVDVSRRWCPGELVVIGAGVDIGYDVHDRNSSKEGPYVHDFSPRVTIYRRWHPADGEPDVVLHDWPRTLWLLAPNLGFTYKGADRKMHEIKGSKNKRLMATPDGRKLAVVGPSGVEFAAWGGNMRVTDWIHD